MFVTRQDQGMRFVFLVALVLSGCSNSDDTLTDAGAKRVDSGNGTGLELDAFPDIDAANVELLVQPTQSYSGFDGTHTFQVPIAVYQYDPKDLTIAVSDPSLVDVIPATFDMAGQDNGRYFLLKTKKAGDATITVASRGKTATSTIKVLSYTTAQYAQGETRYRNAGVNGEKACSSCHEAAGGADHSPTALSSSTDQVLRITIRSGIKAGNVPTRIPHKWTVTDPELAGLVAFLRALPARGYTPQ
jgi:mono/diheme cytochrome c family protein